MAAYRTRIAPTPSGYLHLGNAVNMVIAWARARLNNGEVLLRIDDADQARIRDEYIQDVFDTLEWLGIQWQLGPHSIDEFHANWSQRLRSPLYSQVLDSLRFAGKLFACTCTRSQILLGGGTLKYQGTCKNAGHDFDKHQVAWRLITPSTLDLSYPVLRQKEGSPAYNLVSVADDVAYGITHIVRGADLAAVSVLQQYMATTTDHLAPFRTIKIEHHPLITDKNGQKLSKSKGAWAIRTMREQGSGPEPVYEIASRYLGLTAHELEALR